MRRVREISALLAASNIPVAEASFRERLAVYREVGVTHLNIEPQGPDPLGTIERIKSWSE